MGKGNIVLIVDDSISIRKEVKAILEKEGFIVREAGNGIGMNTMIEEYGETTDLILMDLVLKTESGFDLISQIKKIERYSAIPVIILTENADKGSVLTAKSYNVEGYLRKPIDSEELLKRVKNLLD